MEAADVKNLCFSGSNNFAVNTTGYNRVLQVSWLPNMKWMSLWCSSMNETDDNQLMHVWVKFSTWTNSLHYATLHLSVTRLMLPLAADGPVHGLTAHNVQHERMCTWAEHQRYTAVRTELWWLMLLSCSIINEYPTILERKWNWNATVFTHSW